MSWWVCIDLSICWYNHWPIHIALIYGFVNTIDITDVPSLFYELILSDLCVLSHCWCLQRSLLPLPQSHHKQLGQPQPHLAAKGTTPTHIHPSPSPEGSRVTTPASPQHYNPHAYKSEADHTVFISKSRSEQRTTSQNSTDSAQRDYHRWPITGRRSTVRGPTMDFRTLRESNLWRYRRYL